MKARNTLALALTTTLLGSTAVLADDKVTNSEGSFSAPTRGFMLEHGATADKGDVSVDLLTGEYNTAGGVRIGLGETELILNSGLSDISQNELALKVGYSTIDTNYGNWHLAAFGGISYYSDDDIDNYSTYTLGGAFTLETDKAIVTVNPKVAVIDADGFDEEMFSIGLGAYYNILENDYGRFEPGFEISYNEFFEETEYSAGLRWLVNDHATLDFSVLNKYATGINSANETTDFPGVVRFNLAL